MFVLVLIICLTGYLIFKNSEYQKKMYYKKEQEVMQRALYIEREAVKRKEAKVECGCASNETCYHCDPDF